MASDSISENMDFMLKIQLNTLNTILSYYLIFVINISWSFLVEILICSHYFILHKLHICFAKHPQIKKDSMFNISLLIYFNKIIHINTYDVMYCILIGLYTVGYILQFHFVPLVAHYTFTWKTVVLIILIKYLYSWKNRVFKRPFSIRWSYHERLWVDF